MIPRGPRVSPRVAAGLLAVLVVAGLAALTAETHYVAVTLRFARALGAPAARVAGTAIFWPWSIFSWRVQFAAQAPRVFAQAEMVRWGVLAFVALFPPAFYFRVRKPRAPAETYGTAHWATKADLDERGLLVDDGIVLCQTDDAVLKVRRLKNGDISYRQRRAGRLVRDASGLHVLLYAPSGSGKGIAVVVPTLLTWTSSVCVWDTKRELWHLTAGWRSQFSRCLCFDPCSRESHRYNPLDEIRKGTDHEVRDTQQIAEILSDPEGKGDAGDGGTDNSRHWRLSGQRLLEGVILHVLYSEREKSLPGVARFMTSPSKNPFQILEHMITTRHLGDRTHPAVASVAREMMNKTDNELSSVFSTAAVALQPYASDPLLAAAVSASDFRIRDLMHGKAPTSLYLVCPPSDLARLRPVMRLLLNQMARRMTEETVSGGAAPYKHRLLFLLDEFPTLGRMQAFADGIAYFRGYGIKLVLITQSVDQLEEKYGAKNSIVSNCDIRLTYHANDPQTGEYVSKALGTMTYAKETESVSGEKGSLFGKKQASRSVQDHSRPLMTPDEVQRLPLDQAILFGGGAAPYRAKKVVYFDDPRFKARAAVNAPRLPTTPRLPAAPPDVYVPAGRDDGGVPGLLAAGPVATFTAPPGGGPRSSEES